MIRSGQVRFHEELLPLLVPADRLMQYPDNPNNGDIDAIAESIEVNGCYRPVIAQRSTGYIVAGNHTYAALLSLGATEIPVVWLDVDDEQALRVLLGDNELARLAVIDQGLLTPLLEALLETDRALLGTGYSPPAPIPTPIEPDLGYTVTVHLSNEEAARWLELPAGDDTARLLFLLDFWADNGLRGPG